MSDTVNDLPLGSWIFSTDDHLLETSCDFVGRSASRHAQLVPKIVDHNGGDAWLIEGNPVPIAFSDAGGLPVLGTDRRPEMSMKIKGVAKQGGLAEAYTVDDDGGAAIAESPSVLARRANGIVRVEEDFQPGVYDVAARLSDMDDDGIWVTVTIPSMSFGFAGQRFSLYEDAEAGLACVRAYNDWLHEHVQGAAPERFIASAIPWLRDPQVAAEEVRRNSERGFVAMLFPENPERFGFPSIHTDHWDPIFIACEETGTVLNCHLGTGLQAMRPSTDSPLAVAKAAIAVNSSVSALDWVFSGIPVRFPDLRISLTEGGIDFVPLVYGRLESLTRDDIEDSWKSDLSPAEVLLRNFWFAALFDVGAFGFLAEHAPDHLMLETDYPHGDTWWPRSQEHFDERLSGLTAEQREAVAITNAATLYRHPVPNLPSAADTRQPRLDGRLS